MFMCSVCLRCVFSSNFEMSRLDHDSNTRPPWRICTMEEMERTHNYSTTSPNLGPSRAQRPLGRDSTCAPADCTRVVTYLLQFFYCILANIIAGHLSVDDLAAASIGATTITIFGSAFVSGMATALDTPCAQSFGAGDLRGVGLHVQFSWPSLASRLVVFGLCHLIFYPLSLKTSMVP